MIFECTRLELRNLYDQSWLTPTSKLELGSPKWFVKNPVISWSAMSSLVNCMAGLQQISIQGTPGSKAMIIIWYHMTVGMSFFKFYQCLWPVRVLFRIILLLNGICRGSIRFGPWDISSGSCPLYPQIILWNSSLLRPWCYKLFWVWWRGLHWRYRCAPSCLFGIPCRKMPQTYHRADR